MTIFEPFSVISPIQPPISADSLTLQALATLQLPDSDGEPMENDRERIQINLGIESLYHHWGERRDCFAGGNMFIYYSLAQAQEIMAEIDDLRRPRSTFRGPDLFVVLDVDGSYRRQKWVVWEEDGRYPDVIFEFLSPNTRETDLGRKKRLYERTFATREYFCFDYLNPTAKEGLMGWRLDGNGRYKAMKPNAQGWLWSDELDLWVGRWHGTILRDETDWMRFYTDDEKLVLIPAEAENERAKIAEAELVQMKAKLAELEKR